MNEQNDTKLAERAKRRFDESVAGLDGETRSRLNRARHAALAELGTPRPAWSVWLPAGGIATAAIVAVMFWSAGPPDPLTDAPAVVTDMEILLTEDSLEMLEELEFYSWMDLDSEPESAPEASNNVG